MDRKVKEPYRLRKKVFDYVWIEDIEAWNVQRRKPHFEPVHPGMLRALSREKLSEQLRLDVLDPDEQWKAF